MHKEALLFHRPSGGPLLWTWVGLGVEGDAVGAEHHLEEEAVAGVMLDLMGTLYFILYTLYSTLYLEEEAVAEVVLDLMGTKSM